MKNNTKKAVFFDRDNTLINDLGYTYKKKDLKFLPGVIKGLKYLKQIFNYSNYKSIRYCKKLF